MKDKKKKYRVGLWNGLPNYCSELCGYATLKAPIFVIYMLKKHKVALTVKKLVAEGAEAVKAASTGESEPKGDLKK